MFLQLSQTKYAVQVAQGNWQSTHLLSVEFAYFPGVLQVNSHFWVVVSKNFPVTHPQVLSAISSYPFAVSQSVQVELVEQVLHPTIQG